VSGRTGSWRHKWRDRAQLLEAEALVGEGHVPLFVDEHGTLLETSTSNVVFVDGSSLVVPPSSAEVLPGVALEVLLERARELGHEVVERPVGLGDALELPVAVTNSLRGIRPARSLDGVRLPGVPPWVGDVFDSTRHD
jgi:branched-subunit amino acid aminotransferase/4-amino-4-deoxychorismate lyase